jgi:hypothetical protein
MTVLTFYHSGLDSTVTANALTLPRFTPETPTYDYIVDLNLRKQDLNLFTYTLNKDDWNPTNPDEQDVSITFENYATSAFSNLLSKGEFAVDYSSGVGTGAIDVLSAYQTSDAYGIALLLIFLRHYGNHRVLSLFSGEMDAKSTLRTDINDGIAHTVATNAALLPTLSGFVIGTDTTINNAVNSFLNIIQNDNDRLEIFNTQNTVGLSDLLRADDKIQFVVSIFENTAQADLDGTTQSSQQSARMMIRITVAADSA